MEILLYYTARITFVALSLYGLFLAGASVLQLVAIRPASERGRFSDLALAQLLHGTVSLILGVLLSFQLEGTLFSSLTLLVFSWAYLTLEYFGRRWYTSRFTG